MSYMPVLLMSIFSSKKSYRQGPVPEVEGGGLMGGLLVVVVVGLGLHHQVVVAGGLEVVSRVWIIVVRRVVFSQGGIGRDVEVGGRVVTGGRKLTGVEPVS